MCNKVVANAYKSMYNLYSNIRSNAMYPQKLPYDEKLIWYYSDCFPDNQPYKLIRCFLHKNYAMNLHSHDFYEINLVVKGKGVHYTDNSLKETAVGDVIIVPPGSFHGYYNLDGLDVYHLLIHKNFFNKYYSDLNMLSAFKLLFNADYKIRNKNVNIPYFHLDENCYEDCKRIFVQLDETDTRTFTNPDEYLPAMHLMSYTTTIMLIVKLCEAYKQQFFASPVKERSTSDMNIFSVVEYIHLHYAEKITLEDLCKAAFMSKTALSEKFNRFMGQSPLGYVNYYRILVAKKMLLETDKPIAEIAVDTGFFDTSHFSKTYSKYENVSPVKLRNMLKNKRHTG